MPVGGTYYFTVYDANDASSYVKGSNYTTGTSSFVMNSRAETGTSYFSLTYTSGILCLNLGTSSTSLTTSHYYLFTADNVKITQNNVSSIQYRTKSSSGTYSSWTTLVTNVARAGPANGTVEIRITFKNLGTNNTRIGTTKPSDFLIGTTKVMKMYLGTNLEYEAVTPSYLCFTAMATTTIKFSIVGAVGNIPTLQYNKNETGWVDYTLGSNITLLTGDYCWFRGDNSSFSRDFDNHITFSSTANVEASGNVMSLLDKTCKSLVIPSSYCFAQLFRACTKLLTPPEVPATTLKEHCYSSMFRECTNLTTAPELPAMVMESNCYVNMFRQCTSLQTAPYLRATTLATNCYSSIFNGCTSLRTVSNLPARTLVATAYEGMFNGCSTLTISDRTGSAYSQVFRIPSGTSTFANSMTMNNMFTSCSGTRSSNNMVASAGSNKTYYTQNAPVGD